MFLALKIKNCSSFGDEQLFSVLANNKIKDKLVFNIQDKYSILPSMVVFGANASGKSNLLNIFFLLGCYSSYRTISDPFVLDAKYKNQPSSICYKSFIDEYIIEYTIDIKDNVITKENLYLKKSNDKKITIFKRQQKEKIDDIYSYSISYNANMFNNKVYKEGLEKLTPPNKLLLKSLIENNNGFKNTTKETKEQLSIIVKFHNELISYVNQKFENESLYERFINEEKFRNKVNQLINRIDLGVKGINLTKEEIPKDNDNIDASKYEYKKEFLYYENETNKEIHFQRHMVSKGTNNAYELFLQIINTLEKGLVLVVDEIESSLHPYIVRIIIELFNNEKINKNKAQLICSTHDVSLLDEDLFRADQIYFTEKNTKQMTEIFSLNDFKPRKGNNIRNRYMDDRYGGVPKICNLEDIFE